MFCVYRVWWVNYDFILVLLRYIKIKFIVINLDVNLGIMKSFREILIYLWIVKVIEYF